MVEHRSAVPPLGNTPDGPSGVTTPPPPTMSAPTRDPDEARSLAGARALREALRLARLGYVLVPVTITREPDGKKLAKFHTGWKAGGQVRPDIIRDWSVQFGGCSFAILCGPSGIEVLDLDAAEGGPAWWAAEGMPTSAWVVDTPGGGQHLYWRRRPGLEPDDRLVNNAGKVAPGVDARTVGGLVFTPGSYVVGEEDRPYTARTEVPEPDALEQTPRPVLALWARARAARPRPEVPAGQVDQARQFTQDEAVAYVQAEAQRPLLDALYGVNVNDTLNHSALVVGHFVPEFFTEADARAALGAWLLAGPGARNGWTALDHEDEGSITSGLRRGMAEPYARRIPTGSNHLADGVPLPVSTKTAGPAATSNDAVDPGRDRFAGQPVPEPGSAAVVGGPLAGLPEPPTALDAALDKGRLARLVRRMLDAEERPPAPPPSTTNLAMLLAEAPNAVKYRIEGLWPSGGKVLMTAPAKAGKTTTVGNLVRCLADGTPFLAAPNGPTPGDWIAQAAGFAVEPLAGRRVVVLDFEMTRDMLREWLRDQRIANLAGVEVELLRGRTWDPRDEVQRSAWAAHLRSLNAAVLIVDPIGPVLSALGIDESSSSDVGAVLWALDALAAEAGVTELFVVHHAGHEGERARGSSAFIGWPDAIWTLVRDKSLEGAGRRAISASGRDVHLTETVVELDHATRRLSLGQGSRASARGSEHAEIIADIVRQECDDRGPGQDGPTGRQLRTLARDTAIGTKVQAAQDAMHSARRLGLVHVHEGPNRSQFHHPGASCDVCAPPVVPGGPTVDPGPPSR